MKKISVDKKELVSIKKELDRTSKYWDIFLNLTHLLLVDEDWRLIKKISICNGNCSKAIDDILKQKDKSVS